MRVPVGGLLWFNVQSITFHPNQTVIRGRLWRQVITLRMRPKAARRLLALSSSAVYCTKHTQN
jgi:hypothetical protein